MRIAMDIVFQETTLISLLNLLALHNANLIKENPDLPLLYRSGTVYTREKREAWCDLLHILLRGEEDCDGLAAARAGELIARGFRALSPVDRGYGWATENQLSSIPAEVMLLTRTTPDRPGVYHCIVRYRVNDRWYRDDPSARLGM